MSFTTIEIPQSANPNAGRKHTKDEVEAAAKILDETGTVSDGVVYSEPHKKLSPRQRAQYAGFYLRQDLARDGHFDLTAIRCKTWLDEDEGGYRFAIVLK